MTRKWLLAVPTLAFVLLSCGEVGEDITAPSAERDEITGPLYSSPPATNELTGCLADIGSPLPGAGGSSPCDAARNDGFPGVYLLPSLVGSVSLEGTFQSGLAALLVVEAHPLGCDIEASPNDWCEVKTLPVSEGTGAYETAWKVQKNGRAAVPESDWRIEIHVDLGAGRQPLAYRDVRLSDSPSTDQPADDPVLVIQRGSNQPIKFFISNESCDNTGDVAVTCLIGNGGGTLYIGGIGNPNVAFTVGAGNGARMWTAEFVAGNVDVDVPVFGRTVRVTANPEPAEALVGSSILFCEEAPVYETPGSSLLYVIQEDANGQSVLPPIAAPDCSVFQTASAPVLLDVLEDGFDAFASLVLPRPLVATAAVGSLSGGGGSVKRLSDFLLAVNVAGTPEGGDPDLGEKSVTAGATPGTYVLPTDTATVDVRTTFGDAADGATVHFFPDSAGSVACVAGGPGSSCSVDAQGVAEVLTGTDGKASIAWTPGAVGVRELRALGCGIAVPGSDTPATAVDGVLGVLQSCDRDPDDSDGPDGYANGPLAGVTDPFEPIDENEVAINDLPITFTLDVRCDTVGDESVTCPLGDDGGTLRIGGGVDPQVEVVIGTGNGAREYTLEFIDGDIDVDVPVFGRAVRVTADPPFDADERLNGSTISFCEETETYETPGSTKLYVAQQDLQGTTALPEPDVPVSCPLFPAQTGLLDLVGDGVTYLASLIGPRPLIATSAVGSLSGGGGSVKRLSDFQLTVQAAATAASTDLGSVRLGNSVTAQVDVRNDGAAIDGARIWFHPDAGGALTCLAGTDCTDEGGGVRSVVTGTDGAARIEWRPGSAGTPVLRALGCGIAVPGSITPGTVGADGVLGLLQNCDRDPLERLDGDATDDGYANGTRVGNDPFEPGLGTEIALNDLPIEITADVCGTQGTASPDGVRESAWDCAESASFPVNLRGSGPSQPPATLLWMNDGTNLYLAVQLPRDTDETDTSLWFEFDLGDEVTGTRSQADANDDLIGVVRTKSSTVFVDSYLDAGCAASSGQSVCQPTVPETSHGAGNVKGPGATNTSGDANGPYMFYEIVHPLCSAATTDFCVTADGDDIADLGVFLRLSVGKNSQGGTTWPDFRMYHGIDIKN